MNIEANLEELQKDFKELYDSTKKTLQNMQRVIHINTAQIMLMGAELGLGVEKMLEIKSRAFKLSDEFEALKDQIYNPKDNDEEQECNSLAAGVATLKHNGKRTVYIAVNDIKARLDQQMFGQFMKSLNECAEDAFGKEEPNDLH